MTRNEGPAGDDSRLSIRDLLWPHRGFLAAAFGLSIVASVLALLQPIVAGQVIEAVSKSDSFRSPIVLLIALFIFHTLLETLGRYTLELVGEKTVAKLRKDLIARLIRLPMHELSNSRLGDLLSRVTTDCGLVKAIAATSSVNLASGVITVVGVVAVMFFIEPVMAAVIVFTLVVAVVSVLSVMSRIQRASAMAQHNVGRVSSDLERVLSDLRTVKANQTEGSEQERIERSVVAAYREGVRAARLTAVSSPAVQLAASGAFVLILVLGGARVASGAIPLHTLVTILLFALYLVVPVGDLFESAVGLQKVRGALDRVAAIYALDQEDISTSVCSSVATSCSPRVQSTTVSESDSGLNPALEFRGVTFGYTGRPVIRSVSFKVRRNSHTVLFGKSGSGKSTIFALICRLYDPDSGQIILDGTNIGEVALHDARSLVGLVDQDAPLLDGSLFDNLTYGTVDVDSERVMEVVDQVNLAEVVARLPDGLDTSVGEHGSRLSGGERQRVALGRALLSRPRLLLMDEPTAMLDSEAERILLESLERVKRNCTLVTITHRRSTAMKCDSVLFLREGMVDSSGTIDEMEYNKERC